MLIAGFLPRSLFGRLVGIQIVYGVAIVIAFALIAEFTHSRFHLKATQTQAGDWAAQIIARHPELAAGAPTEPGRASMLDQALARIANANPGASFYLIAADGRVIAASIARTRIRADRIDPEPIRAMLAQSAKLPVTVADPTEPGAARIFSVAPLRIEGQDSGYLLMLLLGPDTSGFLSAYTDFLWSDSLKLAVGVTFPALATAVLLLFMILKPVRHMTRTLAALERRELDLGGDEVGPSRLRAASELDQLTRDVDAMARKISALLQRLKDDDRNLRELFASLSHDLRTPLSIVECCLETLVGEEGALSPEKSRSLVRGAALQVRSLSQLIESQFELANLQRPEYLLHPEPFFMAELAHDVVAKFRSRTDTHNLRLEVLCTAARTRVCADVMLIERVLDNLIENAVRHAVGATQIRIEIRENPACVELRVVDDGPGLPAPRLDWLAGRSGAQPPDATSPTAGPGLGLRIVRRILELHDAGLVAGESGEQGACLGFQLPLCDR